MFGGITPYSGKGTKHVNTVSVKWGPAASGIRINTLPEEFVCNVHQTLPEEANSLFSICVVSRNSCCNLCCK